MVYIQENDHNHRLLIASFDWPPGPLGDGSVTVFVPCSSNYAQLHVFIWEMDDGGEGGIGLGGAGGVV